MSNIAALRAKLAASVQKGDAKPSPAQIDYWDHYQHSDAFPCFYYRDKLKMLDREGLVFPTLEKDTKLDAFIKRESPCHISGYPFGKYPDKDPIILAMLAWCWEQRMYPKLFVMLNDEAEADFLLRFRHNKWKVRFQREFNNISAIYAIGEPALFWLEENCTAEWLYRDGRVLFGDETDRTMFHLAFPTLRSISTPIS